MDQMNKRMKMMTMNDSRLPKVKSRSKRNYFFFYVYIINQPMYKISHLIGQVGPILPGEVTQLWANRERRDCKVNLLHVVGCSVDLWPVQLCCGFGSVH